MLFPVSRSLGSFSGRHLWLHVWKVNCNSFASFVVFLHVLFISSHNFPTFLSLLPSIHALLLNSYFLIMVYMWLFLSLFFSTDGVSMEVEGGGRL